MSVKKKLFAIDREASFTANPNLARYEVYTEVDCIKIIVSTMFEDRACFYKNNYNISIFSLLEANVLCTGKFPVFFCQFLLRAMYLGEVGTKQSRERH